MRLSCNGCRILRKGCTDNCTIRPCLQWIHSPESQANATLFLAKFYGRAGLLNLLDAAPPHLRPAVFKSLLYESCGRIVNPVYGSVGLFLTGEWDRCQAAVDAVMMGSDISGGSAGGVAVSDSQGVDQGFVAACDIRHVAREGQVVEKEKEKSEANKMKGRGQFKRNGKVIKPKARVGWVDSSALWKPVQEMSESDSVFSGETVEASLANRNGDQDADRAGKAPLNLNLSLGKH